jgi:RHS repeat-associated protein
LQTRNLSYDAVGNITRDLVVGEGKQLSYGDNNRLQQVDVANQQIAGYEHNAKGQRVIKRVNGKVIHFHYNTADQLIAETDANAQPIREYLYGAGQRLAMVDYTRNKAGDIHYMVNDHLGTPQLLLDAKQQVVWSVDQSPFGEVKTEGSIEQPLRFPGQYADGETGYSYNYFRDYDPTLGRYIESDPIGLEGGVNTFGYVGGRPTGLVDPFGLVNYPGAIISGGGVILGIGEMAVGGGGLIISSIATSSGIAAPAGIPGVWASSSILAFGTYSTLDSTQGFLNAINETKYDGPFAQFGEALYGESGHTIGSELDTMLSVRSAATGAFSYFKTLTGNKVSLGEIQNVVDLQNKLYDKYFGDKNTNYCPVE